MALQTILTKPTVETYLSLAEHQGQTPGTFYGGKPVLYHHCAGADILIAHDELESHPAIVSLAKAISNGAAAHGEAGSAKAIISGVDVWVNSENLALFSNSSKSGVSIPYPAVALHALQIISDSATPDSAREALLMHISLNDTSMANADEDYQMLEISIVPAAPSDDVSAAAPEAPALDAPSTSARGGSNSRTPARILFNAVSACADLHPDPQSDDDEEGEEEDTAPGASGWITAENADQYFDEDGQFVGQQILGPGAGTVRARDEDGRDADEAEVQDGGEAFADVDAKWRRTD
ncbi:hypothetical protein EJ05DRAFT_163078 [Pseudovirgaria hyperparasitica]|uniref:Benzoylformate decarboxylase n=1 Tax=Pseudovirgaria hyperparasitica TaxID=470096 RepID=A0A6A6VUY4_9PEZI|nr:uncharacterized protein EJ05DRAFT_163078 [Pseudovirgaria hyperparasitica]KAF2754043.1 hypothetical protein EJ05DRAFT_163078 [Pseudovirgaria hyperparasitica]